MIARPMSRRLHHLAAVTGAGVLAVALAACSAASGGSGDGDSGSAADGSFPTTVEHAFGKTEVDAQPERPAVVGWGSADAAIALGTIPVGMPEATFGDTDGDAVLEWVTDALDAAGAKTPALYSETDGVPFEDIADTEPDVILAANSGVTQQEYDTLTEIAPTIAYPGAPYGTSWRDTTTMVGQALGKPAEAEKLVSDTESLIADEVARHADLAGKTVMVAWVDAKDPGKVQVYTPSDTRVQFLNDLGLKTAPGVEELAKDEDGFVFTISAEEADRLDADVAVMFVEGGDLSTLQGDPLLSKIPAVEHGSVVIIDQDDVLMALSSPTVLSIPWVIGDLTDQLDEAAAKLG